MKAATEIVQINLQTSLGGGEIYTAFFTRALASLGVRTTLVCHPDADFWGRLDLPASLIRVTARSQDEIPALLSNAPVWILSHGPLPPDLSARLAEGHILTAIAHMPPQGRLRDRYAHYHRVFGVSAYVVDGLRAIGVPVWDTPLYGVADLRRKAGGGTLCRASCYDWDMRKGRDRLLSWLEPLVECLRPHPRFVRRPGISLGIVSRLTPIKQFPQLFNLIAPIVAARPNFNVEIFGAGGYASVRDLRHALRPLGDRVRFWGHQSDVGAIYSQLDYLMTGLPEKEALGLNVIEAQACDTPVLAVDAPPFIETVIDGQTGFLFGDPRKDGGAAFGHLLDRLANLNPRLHPAEAKEHLSRFTFESYVKRVSPIVASVLEAS